MGTGGRRSAGVITVFCVRPRGLNVGNDTIFVGLRHLLREAFDGPLNIVQVPAESTDAGNPLAGLSSRSIHQMNLYGHGVVVGGGNVYENGALRVDVDALAALRLPLMLFSLSYGRVYDHARRLVPRTDAMPQRVVRALNERAALSTARDEATLDYLRGLGIAGAVTGGCPSMLLAEAPMPAPRPGVSGGTLLSVRNPQLMSVPLSVEGRMHATVLRLVESLERDGAGPVRILCHDIRDLPFASSLGGLEYVLSDDVYSHLELLRSARLVVTYRLHAFLPCVAFGTPAVNISYDERSASLVRTIGFGDWDVDCVGGPDVVSGVRDRVARLPEFHELRQKARPRWESLVSVMRRSMSEFARRTKAYAREAVA